MRIQLWTCAAFALFAALSGMTGTVRAMSDNKNTGAESLVIELPATETDTIKTVQEVASDGIVHGTRVYEKEPILQGATYETSSEYYGKWKGPGHAYYKIFADALSPRHFKNSSDTGTISIRYVVQAISPNDTRLQIDAVFVEDGGHKVHPSDGTVEQEEFKQIQSLLRGIQLEEQKTAAAAKQRADYDAARASRGRTRAEEIERLDNLETSVRNLQQKVADLQHDLEVRVKDPGTELKASPFQRAAKLETLAASSDLIVLIVTPHWYGVETSEGHRGWVHQADVEPRP
jgi:hypothetical protein